MYMVMDTQGGVRFCRRKWCMFLFVFFLKLASLVLVTFQ